MNDEQSEEIRIRKEARANWLLARRETDFAAFCENPRSVIAQESLRNIERELNELMGF